MKYSNVMITKVLVDNLYGHFELKLDPISQNTTLIVKIPHYD